jgi:hypothetical protein
VEELARAWRRVGPKLAIITTTPNELCAEIHNRMPVILKPETWPTSAIRGVIASLSACLKKLLCCSGSER